MRMIVALVLLASMAAAQDSPWEIRLLPGEESWFYSEAFYINNHGQIAGQYGATGDHESRVILWEGDTWFDVGIECGQPEPWPLTRVRGFTDAGLMAGVVFDGAGAGISVIWDIDAKSFQRIQLGQIPSWEMRVSDLNESGQAVGMAYGGTPILSHPWIWDHSSATGQLLTLMPGFPEAIAAGIGENGWVCGSVAVFDFADLSNYVEHAVAWRPDGSIVDLHSQVVAAIPGVLMTSTRDINDKGEIFGEAFDANWWQFATQMWAWKWSPEDGVTVLDGLGRIAKWVFMVDGRFAGGTVGGYTPGEYRGIVWIDGIPHLLPTVPGFGNVICHGANDSGVIVGDLIDPGGQWWWFGGRAFIAEPTAEGDFDGDALKDKWELAGYDHDSGTHVDLPSMGANPLRRDLFVEIDAMTGHRPDAETLKPVVDAFAAHGIALHIDIDDDLPFDPNLGTLDGEKHYQWDEFDGLKSAHFAEELGSAVRYCVFAHRLADPWDDSGLARGEPSSDFIVSLGAFVEESGSTDPWMQAGTFMHELGHTLGLRHGGADVTNRKPNYLSVMNYDFQKQGLRIGGQDGNFDYSTVRLGDLDENALVEGTGLGVEPLVAGYQTIHRVVFIDPITFEKEEIVAWSGEVQGAIDWDMNGTIDAGTVGEDINANGVFEVLKGHDDWSNLDFEGGTVGFGVGIPPPPLPPETEVVEELTVEEAKLIPPPPVEGLAGRAGRGSVRLSWTPVGPYGQGLYRVYRWSATQPRRLVAETQASLVSDRPGRGTFFYVVTVVDSVGAESLDSEELRLLVR